MNEICKPDAVFARVFLPQKQHPGLCYVPSQFALPFTHGGRHYVFNLLSRQCVEAELPVSAHAGEGFDELIGAMFLVPEGKDECAYYESVSAMLRLYARKEGARGYTILPTLGCNARCVYCYEEGRAQVTMTPEIVEQTIRYILDSHADEEVKLHWFGGEPLLCPEILDRISEGLREAGVPYRSGVISNGSLITPAILEKMLGLWNVKRIQISMDGAEPDYRARKRYFADAGQYRSVMDSVGRLSEAGIRVAVRCNVDEGNIAGAPRFLDDLSRTVGHKENVFVYFSPLMDVRAGEGDLAFWEKIIAVRPLIEKAGFRPLNYMGPGRKLRVNRCMADGGAVVIGPDGSLYACEHCPPESRFGDVFNGVTDEAAGQAFRRADRTREKCRRCPFLPECTSFASCPWKDTHCREMHERIALDALRRLVERRADKEENTDGEDLFC